MVSNSRTIAPALSWDKIGRVAEAHRERLGMSDRVHLPVIDIMERVLDGQLGLFEFMVGEKEEMGAAEGYTHPSGDFVMLREDVYLKGLKGDGRARWTAAHEWGHWALHAGQPLARVHIEVAVKPYQCAETQAHQFAAELLVPRALVVRDDDECSIAKRFGISQEAAQRRVKFLRKLQLVK
jgi:hypothetical protein